MMATSFFTLFSSDCIPHFLNFLKPVFLAEIIISDDKLFLCSIIPVKIPKVCSFIPPEKAVFSFRPILPVFQIIVTSYALAINDEIIIFIQ